MNGAVNLRSSVSLKEKPVLRFNPKELADYLEQQTMQFANMGFPFVQISLDSISYIEAQIEANLKVSKDNIIHLKIHIKGDSSVSQRTIQAIIDYQLDVAYALSFKVRDVDRKIEQCSIYI